MNNERKKILARAYLVAALILLFSVSVFARLIYIQTHDTEKYKNLAQTTNFRNVEVVAARGNLYASDGILLATTITKYDIYIDMKTIRAELYQNNIGALCDSLQKMFNKPSYYFYSKLNEGKKKENQYLKLAKGLDYEQFARIKNFPILNKGKNKGGFIVERRRERIKTISGFGIRTLGFDDERGKSGLEGAFSCYLKGKNGREIQQRINQKQWKPINIELEPQDGNDVYTTIDMRIQDIAYSALQDQLEKSEADHGCAIVMEVSTGKIVALTNLQRTKEGGYDDLRNFAVWEAAEPGSTFKSISMLALLDDGYVGPNTTVDIGPGYWKYYKHTIRDDHGSGIITLSQVLSQSSNVGISKMIDKYFSKNPQDFLNKINSWGIDKKTYIDIPGESVPYIPKYGKKWSPITLAWMSFGYGVKLTPLQILTFYNGVANNGKLMKPQLLYKIEAKGILIEKFTPIVINQKMASQKAINDLKKMLTYAVETGTSKSIYTPNLSMAGKTGTAQVEYWNKGKGRLYQASFCGFFPADQPEYSCIVVINKPKKGFYGSQVAAPVFKEIAGKVYLKKPLNLPKEDKSKESQKINLLITKNRKLTINPSTTLVPNVIGYYGKDAIPALENLGLKVVYSGNGKVIEQSIIGYPIKKGMTVYLKLSA
ncbi:cell division protein FtsI (penicillin-binding protein 3) [Apibacter mensalis]|uniref:Cell division protein FtsI (Penicillin-binding protein 3) n=1 Tax=Apibacter mensalis TaxID=1586267 RepID=A0A0X3AMW5_9FLAO|nr:penicillin-binding protein [Apibacter mensalis]CVK15730.1 cell division protein FtsI (penicillin-binding protein 3) [Apibacter mensalis]